MAVDGNVNESSHAGGCPRKSFLFFLTVPPTLESDHPEIGCSHWESSARLAESGAHSTALETLEERHSDSCPAVLITASGLQGEQPLVDGTM